MTWTPAEGDAVAIVHRNMLPIRAEVTRVMKRQVEVTLPRGAVRRFSLPSLAEVGSDRWNASRIEAWTDEHEEASRRGAAIGRLRKAADAAFASGVGRERIEALPVARIEEAAAFLRELVEEANRGR